MIIALKTAYTTYQAAATYVLLGYSCHLHLNFVALVLQVLVMPLREVATVRSIERDSCLCSVARAGDNVAVSLQGIDVVHVTPGGVLCHPDYPVTVASRLELKILVLDIMGPILVGSKVENQLPSPFDFQLILIITPLFYLTKKLNQFEFHIHHAKEAARLVKIVSLVDQKTGEAAKKTPRFLTAKQSAIIEVKQFPFFEETLVCSICLTSDNFYFRLLLTEQFVQKSSPNTEHLAELSSVLQAVQLASVLCQKCSLMNHSFVDLPSRSVSLSPSPSFQCLL